MPLSPLLFSFFLLTPRQPRSTLFPYTTLFRSRRSIERVTVRHLTRPKPPHKLARRQDLLCIRRRILAPRSEEHTSELQSLRHLVCRLLLEKKKTQYYIDI